MRPNEDALTALQANLGHFFKDEALLLQALTHPSASAESGRSRLMSYERLEFLGDSLINVWVAEMLFHRFRLEEEGVLSKLKAYWVSGSSMAEIARELRLDRALLLGAGEKRSGGQRNNRILAASLEALMAALYLDAGWRTSAATARKIWAERIRKAGLTPLKMDSKTRLQEYCQGRGMGLPVYRTREVDEGYHSVCLLGGSPTGEGTGSSKKAAEQGAAGSAIETLPDLTD
ncbi:MAG: ribonuclease III [Acidobacteriota bacterium]